MNRTRLHNAIELAQAGFAAADIDELQNIARRLHVLDENACNYEQTPRQEKAVGTLEKKAGIIANNYQMVSYHQGDPRGWSLYIGKAELLGTQSINAAYDRLIGICPH